MNDQTGVRKIELAEAIPSGIATTYRLLSVDDGEGVRTGIAEFSTGELDFDLTYDEGLYILSGEIFVRADGQEHRLLPGDFLWMPANRKITYRAVEPTKFFYVIPQDRQTERM